MYDLVCQENTGGKPGEAGQNLHLGKMCSILDKLELDCGISARKAFLEAVSDIEYQVAHHPV